MKRIGKWVVMTHAEMRNKIETGFTREVAKMLEQVRELQAERDRMQAERDQNRDLRIARIEPLTREGLLEGLACGPEHETIRAVRHLIQAQRDKVVARLASLSTSGGLHADMQRGVLRGMDELEEDLHLCFDELRRLESQKVRPEKAG